MPSFGMKYLFALLALIFAALFLSCILEMFAKRQTLVERIVCDLEPKRETGLAASFSKLGRGGFNSQLYSPTSLLGGSLVHANVLAQHTKTKFPSLPIQPPSPNLMIPRASEFLRSRPVIKCNQSFAPRTASPQNLVALSPP
jgi:hypothetical protein